MNSYEFNLIVILYIFYYKRVKCIISFSLYKDTKMSDPKEQDLLQTKI
jgi:hypothetical protein